MSKIQNQIFLKLLPLITVLVIFLKGSESVNLYSLETKYIEVPVDHLSATETSKTFQLRYLINAKYYVKGGPIFLYTGGKREITIVAQNTGFLFEIAPIFNALLIFAEHRYYGQSLPFGGASFTNAENLRYLTTTQALGDFAFLVEELKKQFFHNFTSAKTEPIIAFGGYYAGVLSAWLRMRYPHSIRAALTSSAPLFYVSKLTSCEGYLQRVTDVFRQHGHEKCIKTIKLGWDIIENLTKSKIGLDYISSTWNLCKKLRTPDDVQTLTDWLSNIFIEMSLANYPYPTEYYNPVPAFPAMIFCEKLNSASYNDAKGYVQAFAKALQVYTNYTGQTHCNNINSKEDDPNEIAWKYQTCTELIMPKCSTDRDMFITKEWDYEKFALDCYKQFGVRPKPNFASSMYGGNKLEYYKNILFSSSTSDPASWGVVNLNNSIGFDKSLATYQIEDAPYLMEFRAADPSDNNYILQAREFYISILTKWLQS